MTTHIMVDLETLSTEPNAYIIAIGAVAFNEDGELDSSERFYACTDIQSNVEHKFHISAETFRWWLKQSEEARQEAAAFDMHLNDALVDLYAWLNLRQAFSDKNYLNIWGNGASFDNVILANAYKAYDMAVPWHSTNNRCFRTVKAMYPDLDLTRPGTFHKAIDDALYQMQYLVELHKKYGGIL